MQKMRISEFQKMMKQLYFTRDSQRGVKGTFEWLADELKELWETLQKDDKKAAEEEFADVLAWLSSLANITGIDLEDAAKKKYPGKCPKCRESPCQCVFYPTKRV
jgi:NTP pyrophosphatase (non-canonical NTP hydrolase)